MASRLGRRIFAQAVRPTARVSGRNANAAGRRCASTTEHGAHSQGSDTPWMIGSALVFGPAIAYLLSPSSKKASHATAHSHGNHHEPREQSAKETDETEASAEEADSSAQEAFSGESEPASPSEEKQGSDDGSITDSEGETVSGEEVKDSIQQSANADLPPDAQAHEEEEAKFSSGSPGMTEEAEKPDQNEKPQQQSHTGTLQSDEDSGPTNMGDARKTATSGEAPKEAKDDN